MRKFRKIIIWNCIICILASCLPVRAFAQEGTPDAVLQAETLSAMETAAVETVLTAEPENGQNFADALPSEEPSADLPQPETEGAEGDNFSEEGSEPMEVLPDIEAPEQTESGVLPEEDNQEAVQPEPEETEDLPAEDMFVSADWWDVPLYFQTDYTQTMFGSGSVATSGCSVTALAMVATYLTGHEYLPDELARYFGGAAENNIRRLEIGSDTLQLPYERSENFHRTMDALREGTVAIVLMEGNSLFTTSQHFIVLTGLNEAGRIMVNDPYAPNYEKWDLQQGFIHGFEEYAILKGYSGAWIYDKTAMPEEPFIYSVPAPERGEPRYPHIQLTLEEKRLLARVLWVEARGESQQGQQAVAEVILNRMASGKFADSLTGVIYAENQFRSVPFLADADPYQAQFEAIEAALYGPYVLPEDVFYFATYPVNDTVWGEIGGHIFCYG